jgi:phosphoribosyl 1,2-cyclic phosphate phosphodiesterase
MQCPPLTITFLGTGTSSGVPMIACNCTVCTSANEKDKRLRSSILIQSPTTTLVIDTTPDFRTQMLRAEVKKLDAVLFTHPHKDHVAGLDDIKAYNYFMQKPMEIFCNALTQQALIREFPYIFTEQKYPGIPEVNITSIDLTPFFIGDIPVVPVLVWHMKMPVFGYRFGHFTYITDANKIEPMEKDKIKGSAVLVLNALRREKHISHFTLEEAAAIAKESASGRTYFTHISHQLGLHEAINEELPADMALAWDRLKINI